jgi:hypothetical protein
MYVLLLRIMVLQFCLRRLVLAIKCSQLSDIHHLSHLIPRFFVWLICSQTVSNAFCQMPISPTKLEEEDHFEHLDKDGIRGVIKMFPELFDIDCLLCVRAHAPPTLKVIR